MIKLVATVVLLILAVIIMLVTASGCSHKQHYDRITDDDRGQLSALLESLDDK